MILLAVWIGMAIAGCGARTEYSVDSVEIDRLSWDSLTVDVTFNRRSTLTPSRTLKPDSLFVVALGDDGDTLFAGEGPGFAFPDYRLGDREGVMFDVCGALRGRWICEQVGVRASPKRIHAQADFDFPTDDDFRRGRYAIAASVERQEFDGDRTERIPMDRLPPMLVDVFVEGSEAARVRFPASHRTGSFDLSTHSGYSDFRFYLDSRLMDEGEAEVHFVLHGGFEAEDEPIAHVVRTVSAVRKEDRDANIEGFARQAGRALSDELATFFGTRHVATYVHAWHLDEVAQRYEIDVEVRWRGAFIDQREYVLVGVLGVGVGGQSAVFQLREGNRNALDRWDRRIRSTERRLGNLQVVRPPERYRPGSRRQDPL